MKIGIITGASSGMGYEFIRQLDKKLNDVEELWLISRSIDETELPETLCSLKRVRLDLTDVRDIVELGMMLKKEKPKVKVLVNSAGIGRYGHFGDVSYNDETQMMKINMDALVNVTRCVLPYMIPGAAIINMASSAAFLPQKNFAIYAASKSFVLSFSRALKYELKEKKISVTSVCPGPVKTAFFENAGMDDDTFGIKKYFYSKPEKVVKKAVSDAITRKEMSVYGLSMKLFLVLSKIMPHGLLLRIYDRIV